MLILEIAGKEYSIELYDNPAAKDFAAALPQTIAMSRWGGEYYGRLAAPVAAKGETRDTFAVGEVALWPPGNAFCIFFGPTPASDCDEPKMASPGVPLGRLTGDATPLDKLGPSVKATLRRA
ncbi:cyclophilin-like fold protein [Anaeroselena agilis]|uniref:Cyclophilin-like fold protein n=1 Tax=Anaeroselena agilis TaxID=3063788 RepID=A0ABU3P4H3_9FIRM|nr:cyclophilin-like fold protein [Selenomonadales bacterium 4137-cl]